VGRKEQEEQGGGWRGTLLAPLSLDWGYRSDKFKQIKKRMELYRGESLGE
jgi:hypothetical protein